MKKRFLKKILSAMHWVELTIYTTAFMFLFALSVFMLVMSWAVAEEAIIGTLVFGIMGLGLLIATILELRDSWHKPSMSQQAVDELCK